MPVATLFGGPEDCSTIHEVIATAGWGITRECVQVVQALDPQAYVLATDDSGRVVGVGFGVGFRASAWIGHLVVRPESRGGGVGRTMFERLLSRLKQLGRWPIYLTATQMGAPLYAKFGFIEDGGWTRWTIPETRQPEADVYQDHPEEVHVRAMIDSDLSEVYRFDAERFGDHRGELLGLFHRLYPGEGLVACRPDGQVAGYVLRGTLGLGPFVAQADAAGRLFDSALRMPLGKDQMHFTFPDSNTAAARLCQAAGLVPVRRWLRMRLGDGCEPDDNELFNASVAHG